MEAPSVRIAVPGGPVLEGRFAVPETPRGVAILCHAYPPLGGSMSNAVIVALQRALHAAGWAALRFNFRGTGRSTGTFDGGLGEVDDALAALAWARAQTPDVPSAIAGWSFGSVVGLIAAARDGTIAACAGIAPPVSAGSKIELPAFPAAEAFAGIPLLLICGTEDSVSRSDDVRDVASRYGGEARIVEGAGHSFDGRHGDITEPVVTFFDRAAGR